jgi:glutamate-1-semialdehyde 2,1-aminomutase
LLTDGSVSNVRDAEELIMAALVDTVRGGRLDVLDALIAREEAALVARTPRSHALHVAAAEHLPGGVASSWQDAPPCPVFIERGAGSRVWDVDGTEYVDLHAGFGTTIAGHAHPAIVAAVADRVTRGTHFAQPVPDIVPVAAELARRFGLPLWRFANSGTESTLAAIHVMRAATGRTHLIKVEGTYHGHHDAVQVSVFPAATVCGPADRPATVREHAAIPAEVAALVHVVPFGRIDAVRRVLLEHPGQVAGMIIEPVMMNIGVVPPPPGYLAELRTLLHAHGALLTFDEVKTGLTIAPGGATERFGVVPDIVCLAKALGGGVPCGAIGGTAEVMQVIADGVYEQVGTFNGNPLTMAAAKAMLHEVLTPAAYCHLDELREELVARSLHVLARYGVPGYVNAYGAKGAIVFSPDRIGDYRDFCRYDSRFGHGHWLYQHNGGVFLPPWGKMEQWTLSVQHSADDIAIVVANLDRFVRALVA